MFLDPLDIANRALQIAGATHILSPTEDSKENLEASFAYDKLRRAELRRNVWRFAIRKVCLRPVDVNTMVLVPAAWNACAAYLPNSVVVDTNQQLWFSKSKNNINNAPGGNNEIWEMYYGPLTIYPFDSTTTYYTGELVYMPGTYPGSYTVFQSLINSNADVPNTATVWSATTRYESNSVVSYSGQQWSSRIELNLNVTPATGPLPFDPTATYSASQTVTGSDNFIYSSVGNGNIGFDPTIDKGVHWTNTGVANAWEVAPIQTPSSTNWRVVPAAIRNLTFSYPIGTGPSSESETRNIFRLPAGFLKLAPQDPKAGSHSLLGSPTGLMYEDWDLEGNFLISQDTGTILLRFVADIATVQDMDDMFCEGLACRIATGIIPPITQSDGKLQTAASQYKLTMGEARVVNAIETGPVEPPEDDWITTRL